MTNVKLFYPATILRCRVMNMKILNIFAALMLICSFELFSSQTATATEKEVKSELVCKKKIKQIGFPNIIKSIAHLRAVVQWTDKVKKEHDEEFALWHNAKAKSVSCKRENKSQYYTCTLSAIPCAHKEVTPKT